MFRKFPSQHELRWATTSKLVHWLSFQFDQHGSCEVSRSLMLHSTTFSSDYSIDHCFNDKLQQQNSGSRKLCMHGNCQYFDWMVFVMKIFRLLAESGRNKQKCAWANCLSTSIGNLIWQNALQSCFISFCVCYPRPSTQEIWLSCLLQWNFEPDRQNFDVSILDV